MWGNYNCVVNPPDNLFTTLGTLVVFFLNSFFGCTIATTKPIVIYGDLLQWQESLFFQEKFRFFFTREEGGGEGMPLVFIILAFAF